MPDHRPFHFRHFSIKHHLSTMKIGTDALLLGAWVNSNDAKKVLDIGTGSGILAMMMAQRLPNAHITAVDLDADSVAEAHNNFETSQWRNRLKAMHFDIREFATTATEIFDLIISNPPFFNAAVKPINLKRTLARHTDNLNYNELTQIAKSLLSENGIFAVVLPIAESKLFIKFADANGLFLQRALEVISVEGRLPNRINMEFSKQLSTIPSHETFVIRMQDGSFSKEYHAMLNDFYLGL